MIATTITTSAVFSIAEAKLCVKALKILGFAKIELTADGWWWHKGQHFPCNKNRIVTMTNKGIVITGDDGVNYALAMHENRAGWIDVTWRSYTP